MAHSADRSGTLETALITGASSGIGLALAEEFARKGHPVVLVARSKEKLIAAADDIARRHQVPAHWVDADLAAIGAPESVFARVRRKGIEVGVLVNNAGVLHEGKFAETELANHRQILQLNICALTELTHLFLRPMLQRGRGRIVQISSTSAFNPVPSLATYAASKAYTLSLGEALALELRGTGVSVTTVCPGFTDTPMIAQHGRKPMRVPLVPNLTPQAVAEQTYRAAMRGEPLLINGWANWLAIEALRHPPLWARREIVGLIQRFGF